MVMILLNELPVDLEGISLFSLKLQETESSFAGFASDNVKSIFVTSCNYPTTKKNFASDQHFGAQHLVSFPREQKFVAWLDEIKSDAEALFLLGDLFDFWFEYKTVVPKVSSVFG
jgi:hypothetical protein